MTRYHHVDVFSPVPYAGNSLAVFVDPPPLAPRQMVLITRELRHFETIFVTTTGEPGAVRAKVFDLTGELDFAGHPVLGAAAVLHQLAGALSSGPRDWTFTLPARTVHVSTYRHPDGHIGTLLDQGPPEAITASAELDRPAIAAAIGLQTADLADELAPAILSTGLRYLIVAVRAGALDRARISRPDFAEFLDGLGAQFAYVLDPARMEGRHWNNDGLTEDVATGSAAGCVAAYLMSNGRLRDGERADLSQGSYLGRPSSIAIAAYGRQDAIERVTVGGDVAIVGTGNLLALPG